MKDGRMKMGSIFVLYIQPTIPQVASNNSAYNYVRTCGWISESAVALSM